MSQTIDEPDDVKGADVTLGTCGSETTSLGAIRLVVSVQNDEVEVIRVEGKGLVYALGVQVANDPLVFSAWRDWHHACHGAQPHDRRFNLTYEAGAPSGRLRLKVKGEDSFRLDAGEEDGELSVVIRGKRTCDPTLVYEAFVGWLRDACLRHFEEA